MKRMKNSFRLRPWLTVTRVLVAAGVLVTAGVLIAGNLGIWDAGDAVTGESTPDTHQVDTSAAGHLNIPDVLSDLGGDHFAGVEVQGRHIVSYWVDSVPNEAKEYAEAEPGGMTIELVTSARFSRNRLTAAVERVVNSEVGLHAGISWASAESDGSGLEIAVDGKEPSLATKREIAKLAALPADAILYTSGTDPVVQIPAVSSSPNQDG